MSANSAGYGIAAHMNTYSTGVKCGNWVEDRFGDEMSTKERPQQPPLMTEARSTLLNPSAMNDRVSQVSMHGLKLCKYLLAQ